MKSGRSVQASSLTHRRGMSSKIQAQIRQVSLYDVSRHAYLLGHTFWGIKAFRPRRVFIACIFGDYWKVKGKKKPGWHDALENLTLRIDTDPKDREKLQAELPPEQSITKRNGGVLTRVEAQSGILGSWTGLDKIGRQNERTSVTHVWRANTSA